MRHNHHFKVLICTGILMLFCILNCEPLVTQFEDLEEGTLYKARTQQTPPSDVSQVKIMVWNIRFGAGQMPWFGDSCGDRVILSEDEVEVNLKGVAETINRVQPDILIINEIDVESKRTAYIDQVQWLLDHTHLNHAAFASYWEVQFIPSDGLGRMNMGNAILSRWKIEEADRIKLSLRGDQDALTQYFYLRRSILKTRIALPGLDNFYVVGTHLAAFSTDNTKQKQIRRLKEELDNLNSSGSYFVAGGDFNLIPPGAVKSDYCIEDKCPGESFHEPGDDPEHKEGSFFELEKTWMQDMYDAYSPAVSLQAYLADEQSYFTHSPDPDRFWDRKIDYLFTNQKWIPNTDTTHQEVPWSDHVAVSVVWEVPK